MQRHTTDVLIVGGGTAGVAAALSASRLGVKVTLVERESTLGGVATRAGIHSYYYGLKAGIQEQIDERVDQIADEIGGQALGFHPEAKRIAAFEMLIRVGVELIYDALAVEVAKTNNKVTGVLFESPDGPLHVDAHVTIDATGDGDVCALAGASYTIGRVWDGLMNNYSVVPRYLFRERISPYNVDGGWVDSSCTRDVSRAYLEGRSHIVHFLDNQIPRRVYIANAPNLGIREGRQIRGEYVLEMNDLIFNRRFPDVVMRCQSHYDTHAYDFANESIEAQIWVCVMGLWRQRIGCDVPFRSFIPAGIDGLLIGCRALSQTHDAAAGLRMQRDMQQVGQVVGVAAALCCRTGCQPRELDVAQLQSQLIDQQLLSKETLSRESSPCVQFGEVENPRLPTTIEDLQNAETIEALIDVFLTENESGKALWWLVQAGERAIVPLLSRLQAANGTDARELSIALALLGNRDGVPHLLHSIEAKDDDTPRGVRAAPRWIASLIALKILRNPCAVDVLSKRIPTESDTDALLHMLHYFIAVIGVLDRETRANLLKALDALLASPTRGDDYTVWGGINRSMKWSIDLTMASLLAALGDDRGEEIFHRYNEDQRGYVRRAARSIRDRCAVDASDATVMTDIGRAGGDSW